jgi:hypothetical protein
VQDRALTGAGGRPHFNFNDYRDDRSCDERTQSKSVAKRRLMRSAISDDCSSGDDDRQPTMAELADAVSSYIRFVDLYHFWVQVAVAAGAAAC